MEPEEIEFPDTEDDPEGIGLALKFTEGIGLVLKFTPEETDRLFKASEESPSLIQWAKQVVMQAVQEKEMANDPHTKVFQLTSQPLSTAHIPSYISFRVE